MLNKIHCFKKLFPQSDILFPYLINQNMVIWPFKLHRRTVIIFNLGSYEFC